MSLFCSMIHVASLEGSSLFAEALYRKLLVRGSPVLRHLIDKPNLFQVKP